MTLRRVTASEGLNLNSQINQLMDTINGVPENLKGAIDRYVQDGLTPGSLTMQMLANNLGAILSAHPNLTIQDIKATYLYIIETVPSEAWGSAEKVKSWLSR